MHRLYGMCGSLPRARHLCRGRPSAGIHEGYRVQRHSSPPNQRFWRGPDHKEERGVARRLGAKKGIGLLSKQSAVGLTHPLLRLVVFIQLDRKITELTW